MVSSERIQRAAALLKKAAPDAAIILFGSHARGDAEADSDVDFLVIEPKVDRKRSEMVRLRDVLRPLRIPVDVVVTSREAYERWSGTPGTLFHEVAREGLVLREGT